MLIILCPRITNDLTHEDATNAATSVQHQESTAAKLGENNIEYDNGVGHFRISCGRCRIPLADKEQFVGHMIISHELSPKEAVQEWTEIASILLIQSVGGRSAY